MAGHAVFLSTNFGTVRCATADRSPVQKTETGAVGDQRSTLNTVWDSRQTCHTARAERRPHHSGPTAWATAERNDTTAIFGGRAFSSCNSSPVRSCRRHDKYGTTLVHFSRRRPNRDVKRALLCVRRATAADERFPLNANVARANRSFFATQLPTQDGSS